MHSRRGLRPLYRAHAPGVCQADAKNYRAGHVRQRTSHRVNAIIPEHIGAGTEVEIYLAMPPTTIWNGLPVTIAAGLEAGLIKLIQPPWNIMSVGQKKG